MALFLFMLLIAMLQCSFCMTNTSVPDALVLKVIKAIERLIEFYKYNIREMNLDGVFGLNVVFGQVQRLLSDHRKVFNRTLKTAITHRLEAVLQESKFVLQRAIGIVKAEDEAYFHKLGKIILSPWTFLKSHRHVNSSLRWGFPVYRSSHDFHLSEEVSDRCMMEILMVDSARKSGGGGHCHFSKLCGDIMTRRGLTDYSITHQILWTSLAEMSGCEKELNDFLQSLGFQSTSHMQAEFCTNNYYEMLAFINMMSPGRIQEVYQDLFMEQQFVCPNLGFFEFLKKDYLDQILSWQMPSGCFGEDADRLHDDALHDMRTASILLMNDIKRNMTNHLDWNSVQHSPRFRHHIPLPQSGSVTHDSENALLHHNHTAVLDEMGDHSAVLGKKNSQTKHISNSAYDTNLVGHHSDDFFSARKLTSSSKLVAAPELFNSFTHKVVNNRPPNVSTIVKYSMSSVLRVPVFSHVIENISDGNPATDIFGRQLRSNNSNNDLRMKLAHAFKNGGDKYYTTQQRKYEEKNLKTVFNGRKIFHSNTVSDGLQRRKLRNSLKGLVSLHDSIGKEDSVMSVAKILLPNTHSEDMKSKVDQKRFIQQKILHVGQNRKLLMEKEMLGGCLAHKTGVAASALAMYLRFLLEPWPSSKALSSFFSNHSLKFFLDAVHDGNMDDVLNARISSNFEPGTVGEINTHNHFIVDAKNSILGLYSEYNDDAEDILYDDGDAIYLHKQWSDPGHQNDRTVVARFGFYSDKHNPDRDSAKIHTADDYGYGKRENDEAFNKKHSIEKEGRVSETTKKNSKKMGKGGEYTYYYDDSEGKRYAVDQMPKADVRLVNNVARSHGNTLPLSSYSMRPTGTSISGDFTLAKLFVASISAIALLLLIAMCQCLRVRRISYRPWGRKVFNS